MMINNLNDLAEMLSADVGDTDAETQSRIERQVYKYTDCGAWIEFSDTGIRIGSIVEGSDIGTSSYALDYPFAEETYRQCEAAIEKEASAIWDWANKIIYHCKPCGWTASEDELPADVEYIDDDVVDIACKCPDCGNRASGETDAEHGLDFPDVWVEFQNLPGFSSAL